VKIDGWFRIDGCARDGQTKSSVHCKKLY